MSIRGGYFSDRNYTEMYLHRSGHSFSRALVKIFTAAYLYSIGVPLYLIFVLVGLEFGLRGLMSPLGPELFDRMGLAKAILVSYVFMSFFFIGIAFTEVSLLFGLAAFVFHSIARGIYDPCNNIIHAQLVENINRSKELTMERVVSSVSGIVSVAIGTFFLVNYSYLPVAVLAIAALFLSTIPLLKIRMPKGDGSKTRFTEPFGYLVSDDFRENLLPFFGMSMAIIASLFIAPLFIFITFGGFETLGNVTISAIIVESLFILLYGNYADKRRKQSETGGGVLQGIGYLGYMFAMVTPLAAFFVQSFNHISWSSFRDSFYSQVFEKIRNSRKLELFATCKQMIICFSELAILSIYAALSYFIGNMVFQVIFAMAILGTFITLKYFRD